MGVSYLLLSKHREYYLWLKRNRKESTCRGYLSHLQAVIHSFKDFPTYESTQNLIYECQLKGSQGSYINNLLAGIKVYTKFLEETKRPCDTTIYSIKKVKENRPEKATLSDEEIEAFLKLPNETLQRHGRTKKLMKRPLGKGYDVWTLFYSILAYSGMRPTEVSHLRTDDIDFGRNVYILRDTKTHDMRYVPIARNIIQLLKKRIDEVPEGTYLFPSARGGNNNGVGQVVDNVDWHYNFHTRLKRLKLKRRNLTVYSLRHSFITRLLGEDVNIFKVQKIVGHKRVETTNQYTHLTTKDIQQAILKDPLYTKSNPQGRLDYIHNVLTTLLLDKVPGLRFTIHESPTSLKFEAELE